MQGRTYLAVSLLAILSLSWSAAPAHGSSVSYAVHGERVSVELSLEFFQNATSMPGLNAALTGSSAQDLTLALEESLKRIVGNVSVSLLSGEVRSENGWVNATIWFDVTGASARKGGLLVVNCSWIPFNVPNDLRLGNLSYNLIGATYVRPAFEKYVDYDRPPLNETIESVTYVAGEEVVPPRTAAYRAGNATLLDFRNIIPPIEKWERTYDVAKGSTVWAYDLAPAVDLEMTVSPREGVPFSARAFYKYNATVSVDGLAQATGNTVVTDVSGGLEPALMFAVVLLTFVVAILASWSYRSRRRQILRRRK